MHIRALLRQQQQTARTCGSQRGGDVALLLGRFGQPVPGDGDYVGVPRCHGCSAHRLRLVHPSVLLPLRSADASCPLLHLLRSGGRRLGRGLRRHLRLQGRSGCCCLGGRQLCGSGRSGSLGGGLLEPWVDSNGVHSNGSTCIPCKPLLRLLLRLLLLQRRLLLRLLLGGQAQLACRQLERGAVAVLAASCSCPRHTADGRAANLLAGRSHRLLAVGTKVHASHQGLAVVRFRAAAAAQLLAQQRHACAGGGATAWGQGSAAADGREISGASDPAAASQT